MRRPRLAGAISGALSSLLEGGISGFTWEGEAAASGDLQIGNVTSDDGSGLDAGDFGNGVVSLPGGLDILSLNFNIDGPGGVVDSVLVLTSGTQTLSGDWTLRPTPFPSRRRWACWRWAGWRSFPEEGSNTISVS